MSFDTDLFISYAHLDNQPIPPADEGWVTKFHAALEPLLEMRMGSAAEIWRDKLLQGTDEFGKEIEDKLRDSAVLLSVLSPRYVESEWCNREIDEFAEGAERTGGLSIDNQTRIVKVLRWPVDVKDDWPDAMKDALGFEFFTYQDETPFELDPIFGPEFTQEYLRLVATLAFALSKLLKSINEDAGGDGSDERSTKPTVYLARCAYDMKGPRSALESELKRLGYKVLPDRTLPLDQTAFFETVDSMLERSDLAIHLVGTSRGAVPDGPGDESAVMVQNQLAAARSKTADLPRIVWLRDGTVSDEPSQQAFIDALHGDAEVQFGADLITGELGTLKAAIHAALAKLESASPDAAASDATDGGDVPLVYVICTEKDRASQATLPLHRFLRDEGLDVRLPAFEGDAKTIRTAGERALSECDAAIIFYGEGDEAWKRSELQHVRRERPDLEPPIYLASPDSYDKQDLVALLDDDELIDGLVGLPEQRVRAFVEVIRAAARAG